MKIAIDIDEVVVEILEKYMNFAAENGFKKIKYDEIYSYDLADVLGVSSKETFGLLDDFVLGGKYEDLDFIDGAFEGVNLLKEEYEIYFITARPKAVLKLTRDFIFNNFRILGDKVLFSGDILGGEKKKERICEEKGIGLIIEDSELDALRYADFGIKVLLLDKPWNQGIEHENIYRCMSWRDILKKVEELNDE
jgi:uncharacterized protein